MFDSPSSIPEDVKLSSIITQEIREEDLGAWWKKLCSKHCGRKKNSQNDLKCQYVEKVLLLLCQDQNCPLKSPYKSPYKSPFNSSFKSLPSPLKSHPPSPFKTLLKTL